MNQPLEERQEVARRILHNAPRLKEDHEFTFSCHPGISCFTVCCADVNIVLTPLDILRMSRALEISTTDFLARYTFVPFSKDQKLPFVFLRMNEDEKKSCPFVTEEGCSIYESRPWSCRMYPVGEANPADPEEQGEAFYFLMEEKHCQGHGQGKKLSIREWMEEQGANEYREAGEWFREILHHPYLKKRPLDPARVEMFYMACYDLDKFREFVFKSRFLSRFRIEPELTELIEKDDLALMRFAYRWLKFALFGEMTLEPNPELLSERDLKLLEEKNLKKETE